MNSKLNNIIKFPIKMYSIKMECKICNKAFKNNAGYKSHTNSKQHIINARLAIPNIEEPIKNYKEEILELINDNNIIEYEGFKESTYLTYTKNFEEEEYKLIPVNILNQFKNILSTYHSYITEKTPFKFQLAIEVCYDKPLRDDAELVQEEIEMNYITKIQTIISD